MPQCFVIRNQAYIIVFLAVLHYICCHQESKHIQEHLDDKDSHVPTLIWAVSLNPTVELNQGKIKNIVNRIAEDAGLVRYQQVFADVGHLYILCHESHIHEDHFTKRPLLKVKHVSSNSSINQALVRERAHRVFDNHPMVHWYSQQILRPRVKRSLHFDDPAYPKQWHLNNMRNSAMDINVTGVWEHNITGEGVTVAVVDDGLEWSNVDIRDNYSPEGSIDLDSNDDDPSPSQNGNNNHGTRCAGEIAAVANTHCAVGVAYKAKVSGIRVLDGAMTDSMEASAFDAKINVNDVYSCSWGPEDDGKTVDGPHPLAKIGLKKGVDYGRHGYGSIFVVASGNGGLHGDNCNFDGYANSIYTITIGAVDETGAMPYYAEECAAMLAVTFSSGSGGRMRNIVTTDTSFGPDKGCTSRHSGTSAAAPIAAGMVALMLQAQPCLSWRDVQHIIVVTARKVDINIAHWNKNKAGLHHSHKHGFGLMDAWRLVNAAKVWEPVPWLTSFSTLVNEVDRSIPRLPAELVLTMEVYESNTSAYALHSLEHIVVTLTIAHPRRGNIAIILVCPSGMQSVIASNRAHDGSTSGFQSWSFTTVRCWGEYPHGTYKLIVTDTGTQESEGQFVKWQLTLHGSAMTPDEVKRRIRVVEASYSGAFLNDSYKPPCPKPMLKAEQEDSWVDGERVLKFLTLSGAFLLVMSVYQTFEYMICYQNEKREQERETRLTRQAQYLALGSENDALDESGEVSDRTRLLADTEDIPLQTFEPSRTLLSDQEESLTEKDSEQLERLATHSCSPSSCEEMDSASPDRVLSDCDQRALVVELPDHLDDGDRTPLLVKMPP